MMQAEWLPIIMQGSFSEIYVVDCNTLRFVQTSKAARKNLGYTEHELAIMTPLDIARHLSRAALGDILHPLRDGQAGEASLHTTHTRKDGSTYPIECRWYCHHSGTAPVYIGIATDIDAGRGSKLETAKEKERRRLAREIHDDLGGNLTAIKMAVAQVKKRLPADDSALADKTAYVDELVDRTIEAAHRISAGLRPGILDLGLVAAIERQMREFEQLLAIPCEFSTDKQDIAVAPEQATEVFRIFQEALTNIGKHAGATRVLVRLEHTDRGILLEIADNGCGIAAADRLKPDSYGIRGMMERADTLGGRLTVSAVPGGGTVVALSIPLSEQPLNIAP